jgi:hypothetical protein
MQFGSQIKAGLSVKLEYDISDGEISESFNKTCGN